MDWRYGGTDKMPSNYSSMVWKAYKWRCMLILFYYNLVDYIKDYHGTSLDQGLHLVLVRGQYQDFCKWKDPLPSARILILLSSI